jgi:adenosylcobinamide kinase / adenosylcobinamide-phosphate guanylyltransferase
LPEKGRLTLVLGGARSGKSSHAEGLVTALPPPWLYLATAEAWDEEMRERIAAHQARRGEGWRTVNAPLQLADALDQIEPGVPVLIDCLTLWLSNHMLAENDVEAECARLADVLASRAVLGSSSPTRSGRASCPTTRSGAVSGTRRVVSTRWSRPARDDVLLMVAGIPMKVK